MFPPGLKGPAPTEFREAPPSDLPPAEYPSRLPFVIGQSVSYAESEDLAICTWPVLPAGDHPAPTAGPLARPQGLRGAVTGILEGIDAIVGVLMPDPATKAPLDSLFERVLESAAASGWTLQQSAAAPFPLGSRHATLVRRGARLQVMAVITPSESVVSAWSFADSAA